MGAKRKAVINAEAGQLAAVEALVRGGRYASVSELVREAITEKLEALRLADLARQVEAFCDAGHAEEDLDLVAWQAFPGARRRAKR